jgi:hypothetical protein
LDGLEVPVRPVAAERSESEFAMRAEADEFQGVVVGPAIDENEIWANVAIAAVVPIAAERMVAEARW